MNRFLNIVAYVVYAVLALPVVFVVGASFTSAGYLSFPPQGLSLRWWNVMVNDREMMMGFWISVKIALLTVLISLPVGALAAIYLGQVSPQKRNLLATLFGSPLSVPMVLTGFSLLVLLTQLGLLNQTGLVIGHTVISVPYVLRSALSSMSLSDPSLPRAAAIHGARPWQVLWHVRLPALRPGLISGGLFSFLASINNVVISVFISQPGISPLPVVIFSRMENLAEPSVAAASTAVIVVTALCCLLLERRYQLFRSLAGR
ncbi:MAG: ABC transporter permease [Pseudomonadota bacterium]|nr:ABC transporter permease [Hyphomicrobiales bacterium]